MIDASKVFVGVARRVDGQRAQYPRAYVTMSVDGTTYHFEPLVAKMIGRKLMQYAGFVSREEP